MAEKHKKLNKKQKISIFLALLAIAVSTLFFCGENSLLVQAQQTKTIDLSAVIVNNANKAVPNGEYEITFAIYSTDNSGGTGGSSSGGQLWRETQPVAINSGVFNAYLGSKNPFPESINFETGDYYLGIKIGNDGEMAPRKKIGAVPQAINSYFLRGATTGAASGDIPVLGSGGKLDTNTIPDITSVGVVSNGTWEGDTLAIGYGGTGLASYTAGDMLYASAKNKLAALSIGTSGQYLTVSGGLPAWGDLVTHDIITLAGAYDYLTLSGQEITLGQIDLATDVTGTLPAGSGGTGATSFTAGSVIFSNGTALAQDNANFFWDDTNKYLGIGTASPGAKLDVAGHIWQTGTGQSVFLGEGAGASDALSDNNNTLVGYQAGYSNTAGKYNLAMGNYALYSNTLGWFNLAIGSNALYSNTTGSENSALGRDVLYSNTTGGYNLALGRDALYSNTTGNYNSVVGTNAFFSNITGSNNVALGTYAGAYETGSNTFYVNNQDRSNISGDRTKSLMYGVFADLPANQTLTINANVGIGDSSPDTLLDILSSAAVNTQLTITNTNAGNYNPQIGFQLVEGTNLFTMGVAENDSSKFKISTMGLGTSDRLVIDSNGLIGIGSSAPEFRLTLDKGAGTPDGGILAIGTYGSGTALATAGTGTRMIWYPKKAAFRAGYVNGTQWNDANIGAYSFASGYNAKASGIYSFASGYATTASNDYTIAMGYATVASNYFSIAMGNGANSSGNSSVALGSATASGDASAAVGGATASGSYSFASGNSTASGNYSAALGTVTASGDSSFAAGKWVTAGSAVNTIVLGQGAAVGSKLVNSTASSLMVGFNSTVPTLFVGPSAGAGTTGKVGIGTSTTSAYLTIKAGTNAAGTAPLKFNVGTNLDTAEAGAMEYDGTDLFFTPTGTTRETIAYLSDIAVGVTDHGDLTGLDVDDHTIYALLAGRTAGQTLIGGTGTTDDLILRTTSGVGASGADMIFQVGSNGGTEAMRILNSGYVGIGTASPTYKLDVSGSGQFTGTPTGVGVSQGTLYVNPSTMSSASAVSWSAKTAWNAPDVGTRSAPAFADLDNDGDFDLLIGENAGVSYAYENTGSASSPVWTAKTAWNAPDVGLDAKPAFADLDNDGDYDLLIGETGGISYGYENTGTASSPVWTAKTAWNTPDVGTFTSPTFADLDNDGDFDLLIGENAGVSYAYENTGSASFLSGQPKPLGTCRMQEMLLCLFLLTWIMMEIMIF